MPLEAESPPSAIVLGGGLSGVAAALALARAGWRDVTIIEKAQRLGGLAGDFVLDDRVYPLGYHHILPRDRTLLSFLALLGARERVFWQRITTLFQWEDGAFDLSRPGDFWRFPLVLADKLKLVRLMALAYVKSDWRDWSGRAATELIDRWGSEEVRRVVFEPLVRLKFEQSCDEVSAAWLGARLHYREGADPFGYIPETNWTTILCNGLTRLLEESGVRILVDREVIEIKTKGSTLRGVALSSGERLEAELFVSSIPTEVYARLAPEDSSPGLKEIRYSAAISAVCSRPATDLPKFYWMNLTSQRHTAAAVFNLSALNPTIGGPGEQCINLVTHVIHRRRPLFRMADEEIMARYLADFKAIFRQDLSPTWWRVNRIPMYSPLFGRDYRNPPVRSIRYTNVYFAGNYRTFPSIASTGTALASGIECARTMLSVRGQTSELFADLAGAEREWRWPMFVRRTALRLAGRSAGPASISERNR